MKIICIGRNYVEHARELNNEVPDKPVIFMKPDTALLRNNAPFYLPEWSKDINYEGEVVLRIGKNGKYIDEKFAHKYVSDVTMGVDFTARDLQSELKGKGLPWELAKAFDGSAVIGELIPVAEVKDMMRIAFRLDKNGETVQQATTDMVLFSWPKIIAFVSQFFSLRQGDLIFTGTPKGVGPVAIGDQLTGYLDEREVFSFNIK